MDSRHQTYLNQLTQILRDTPLFQYFIKMNCEKMGIETIIEELIDKAVEINQPKLVKTLENARDYIKILGWHPFKDC